MIHNEYGLYPCQLPPSEGLLRPTPTLQEPRQTGQPPLKEVYGPRAGATELGWQIHLKGVLFGVLGYG